MAKILPVPEPNVATQPVATPYERPFATAQGQGEGLGSVLEQAGGVAEAYARDAKQKADTAMELGAAGKAKAALNTIILDPENGYASLRGDDAMKGRAPALQKFGKALEDIRSSLTADQQRRFEPHAQAIQEQAFTHVVHHETLEQERYAQAQYRGNVDQTMETAENPAVVSDPAALKQQFDSLIAAGSAEGQRRFGKNASLDAIKSILVPELQKAAIGTMEAATAAAEQGGDPKVAQGAFDQVGRYLITGHQRQYAARIEALTKKATVTAQAAGIIARATSTVPMPGGDPVPRVDAGKLASGVGTLDPNDRFTPDVVAAVEKQETLRAKVWNANASQIVQRVYSAGQDPGSGAFDISSPKISAQDKVWLQQNEPELYGRLYAKSQADLRRDVNSPPTAQERRAAVALRVDLVDHPEKYATMTEAQFDAQAFDKLHPKDYSAIGGVVARLQQNVGKMADVAEQKLPDKVDSMLVALGRGQVFPTGKKPPAQWNQDQVDLYMKAREGVMAQARQFVETSAKPPTYADYERFIRSEFVKGTVPHDEPIFPGYSYTFRDRATRLEFEAHPEKYRGTQFVPDVAAAAPAAPIPVRAASPVAPPPAQFYRYTPDRKTRYPTDAKGNVTGPAESVP